MKWPTTLSGLALSPSAAAAVDPLQATVTPDHLTITRHRIPKSSTIWLFADAGIEKGIMGYWCHTCYVGWGLSAAPPCWSCSESRLLPPNEPFEQYSRGRMEAVLVNLPVLNP